MTMEWRKHFGRLFNATCDPARHGIRRINADGNRSHTQFQRELDLQREWLDDDLLATTTITASQLNAQFQSIYLLGAPQPQDPDSLAATVCEELTPQTEHFTPRPKQSYEAWLESTTNLINESQKNRE